MAIDLTKMIDTNYMDQIRDGLKARFITEGVTASVAEIYPNVKNVVTLNGLTGGSELIQEGGCGFDPQGTVALTQKRLEVFPKKINTTICPEELEKTYLSTYMRTNKEVPFEEVFMDKYVNIVKNFNEKYIWIGENDNASGILYESVNDTAVVAADTEVDAATTYVGKINALMAKAPSELLTAPNGVIFCSFGFYQNYMNELRQTNVFMLANSEYVNGGYRCIIPGTNVQLIATEGLSTPEVTALLDSGELLFYTTADNIVIGTDMVEGAWADAWYSREDRVYKVDLSWKIGATYRWGENVVRGYALV